MFLKNTSFACIKDKIENLLSHLQLTYTIDTVSVSISASAGVVSVPKDGTNFKDLYTAADKALYETKKTKKKAETLVFLLLIYYFCSKYLTFL